MKIMKIKKTKENYKNIKSKVYFSKSAKKKFT